jgi:uncharacterized RDD family membrane protein YckC
MADSQIITSQYVRIDQTPAGVGERIFARMLDYLIMFLYGVVYYYAFEKTFLFKGDNDIIWGFVFLLPVIFYSFLWETFNQGRSPGKMAFGMRVVMLDGTTPTVGVYFMRWLLLLMDNLAWMGVVVILLSGKNQRMGDLAAGTLVIKEKSYRHLHVSLDEFHYLSRNYRPVFLQAENLSLEQINTINETLTRMDESRQQRIALLSNKVKEVLQIAPAMHDEKFLQTLIRDYQYYALEEI